MMIPVGWRRLKKRSPMGATELMVDVSNPRDPSRSDAVKMLVDSSASWVKNLASMRPAGRWGATAWSCSIAILVAAWSIVHWPAPMWMLADIDCAHQLGGASQILRGEHPFVDWHTDYGALRYYPS